MARVSQTTLKRLDKLDAPLRERRQRSAFVYALVHGLDAVPATARTFTRAQRTVLDWPRIAVDGEEWEAQAMAHQAKLIEASAEDRAVPDAVVKPAPVPNNNADHNAANRAAAEVARQGGRPLLDEKERQVRQATQPRGVLR